MIPVFKPSYDDEELDAIREVLQTGWSGLGPKTEEFEKEFAKYCGAKYAVGLNSCTAALHLAMNEVAKKKNKNEYEGVVFSIDTRNLAVTTPITFVSTAYAILYAGMRPIFCDVEEDTLNMDLNKLEDILKREEVKAVIPVHYGGNMIDTRHLYSLTYPQDIVVIEDCAHAAGASSSFSGKAGESKYSAMSCFSFHAVKNLSCGDGGMITTNNKFLYDILRQERWCGIDKSTYGRSGEKYKWDYDVKTLGFKCHMNDITAAIGLVQLRKLDKANARRNEIANIYDSLFKDEDKLRPLKISPGNYSSRHNYVIRLDDKIDREDFIQHMNKNDISVGVHYKPLYLHPYFKEKGIIAECPVADKVWPHIITLPMYPSMTDEQAEHVAWAAKTYGM